MLRIPVSAFSYFLLPHLILLTKPLSHPLPLPLSVATKVKDIVVESAADPSANGLLGLVQAQGVNTDGLKSTVVVNTENVVYESDLGVSIEVRLKTDDHPRKWTCFAVN